MIHRYAQLNSSSVCMGISQLSDEVDMENMIPISDSQGAELCGKKWTGEEWIDGPIVEVPDAVPEVISDRQFFQQLAVMGQITEQEALDAVGPGTIPAAMDALVSTLPADQQFGARMLIRGATTFLRHNMLTMVIAQLYDWDEEHTDEFWRAAAKL